MRIGQFSDTFMPIVDGVGRVVYNYADMLARAGHECYVVAPMHDTGFRGRLPFEIVDYSGMPLVTSPQYKVGIPILDRHYHDRISSVSLDIVHAHSPFIAGQEALRIARQQNIPIVGTFHSKYYDDFYSTTRSEVISSLGVKYVVDFYERCDEVWTVSNASAEVLEDYGYHGSITVMPNGTETKTEPQNVTAACTDGKPLLLYVGQIHRKKNIGRILEACALLKRSGYDFSLVLAGQGPDSDGLKNEAALLGISERVTFTGHISDMSILDGLYKAASLFLFPSLYDTAGLVVREAAAMGTPSVAVRGSCAAEVIADGVNGLLCHDDGESLFEAIKRGLDAPEFLAVLGENARKTIPLGWDKVIEKVQLRYLEIISHFDSANAIAMPDDSKFGN